MASKQINQPKKVNTQELLQENNDKDVLEIHNYGDGLVCMTDSLGYANPRNLNPLELVVDASEGFIPLWEKNQVLRWKFDKVSLSQFKYPDRIKDYIRELMAEALNGWDYAIPIRFSENEDNSDFRIIVNAADNCNIRGCTLARAFFPDSGRHDLVVFPKMFDQNKKEQVDTMMHELGHVFGLRHFFAKIKEKQWASEIFGEHKPFSIMNYGALGELTEDDKRDLHKLYNMVWSGQLKEINSTPIKLVKPFHATRS